MLLDQGLMPLITKATRITNHTSTLIDYIYTNTPEKVLQAGICLADISDHLPVFCTVSDKLPVVNDSKFFRDFKNFDDNLFLNDIRNVDFNSLISNDVNESMNNVINILEEISDKHAPLRKLSNKKKKQLNKPWISNGILKSIKRKQKLFKTNFLSNDPEKVKQYKI